MWYVVGAAAALVRGDNRKNVLIIKEKQSRLTFVYVRKYS